MSQPISTDDVRIREIRPLTSPSEIMASRPLSAEAADRIGRARGSAESILEGQDDRLLVVAGPCSIHDKKAALEYGALLAAAAEKHSNDLELLMRVYFEKPRTTVGWKGYINDPDLDGSYEIETGLQLARELLLELTEIGAVAGTEFLDTITPQYIADIVAWGAIGARTTESQIHRQLASGLSMPVGFKNGTDGNVKITLDAIGAAAGSHHFLSVTKAGTAAIVETAGNSACHVILRGSSSGPNHDQQSVQEVLSKLRERELPAHLMIDCSHGNSRKDHRNQPGVCDEIAAQVASGERGITGIMIESHLVAGKQQISTMNSMTYGQSITDACVDWNATEAMLEKLASAVRARRDIKSN